MEEEVVVVVQTRLKPWNPNQESTTMALDVVLPAATVAMVMVPQ